MLESVEIIIDLSTTNIRVHDLIENFSSHNFDTVEFTVHVENSSLRLRLLNQNEFSMYDGSLAVETFAQSIARILDRRNLPYSIIEHLNLDVFNFTYGSVGNDNGS